MLKNKDIRIRDPYILVSRKNNCYYMYGTTDVNCWGGKAEGFNVYTGSDLENWEGPIPAFRPPEDFWADRNFWAPEVHYYRGRYYMFASFKSETACRGTQILVSDKPEGPFVIHSKTPVTPADWECLDGTLYVDDEGMPWIVFCHEWLQVYDGEICALRLSSELDHAIGKPVLLFRASECSWSQPFRHEFQTPAGNVSRECRVTDGPFLYRAGNGELLMLWSTDGREGYTIGVSRSVSGNLLGPWKHDDTPLFGKDGGHGMLFRTFDGQLKLSIHQPNGSPNERPVFFDVIEKDGKLTLK